MTTIAGTGASREPLPVALNADEGAACRGRATMDRVGNKWTLAVVYHLGSGPRRFSELGREVPGISQRMLTTTLRNLERDGFVSRTVFAVIPPRVDYELTPLGRSLLAELDMLITWAVAHTDGIDEAHRQYDAR